MTMASPNAAQQLNNLTNIVLGASEDLSDKAATVQGFDFNQCLNDDTRKSLSPIDFSALLDSFATTGFQATEFDRAVKQINNMINWKPTEEDIKTKDIDKDAKCKIFLGYTSNMSSCGVREIIRFLVEHKMVDVLVTTAGGIEEDLIKCMAPSYMGDFNLDNKELRKRGLNRIGNLLVPNKNYCLFEDWMKPILDECVQEQKETGQVWSPSRLIHRLGQRINHSSSICYWAAKNNIPIYSPALTDGSIGDMIFFHSYNNPGLVLDIVQDIRGINTQAMGAPCTGMIILGGGVIKHHILNANLMRNGADFSVFVNTATHYDGSDSGATPGEAISWGKIRIDADPVKLYGEASILFPLLVSKTFAPALIERKKKAIS